MKKILLLLVSLMILSACNKTDEPVEESGNQLSDASAEIIGKNKVSYLADFDDREIDRIAIDEKHAISFYVKNLEQHEGGWATGVFYLGLLNENEDLIQEINLSTYNPFAGDGGGVPMDAENENNIVWLKESAHIEFFKNDEGLFELTVPITNSGSTMTFEAQFYEGQLNMVQ